MLSYQTSTGARGGRQEGVQRRYVGRSIRSYIQTAEPGPDTYSSVSSSTLWGGGEHQPVPENDAGRVFAPSARPHLHCENP
jgi:hypothetical protein